MNHLKKYIHAIADLNEKDWDAIAVIAISRQLKKGEVIINIGDKCEDEVFVEKGVIRAYLADDNGNEKSTAFFQQGEFMGMKTLRTSAGKSVYGYQALCATTAIFFNSQKLKAILSATNKLKLLGKAIKEKELNRLSEKESCLMPLKAQERYLKFLQHHPKIESRVAQHHIASYLGVTSVSLSRIKKKA